MRYLFLEGKPRPRERTVDQRPAIQNNRFEFIAALSKKTTAQAKVDLIITLI